jgi:hypothetical protein
MNPQKTANNKYLNNQDLIRFSSHWRKMLLDKIKRGDCDWVLGYEKSYQISRTIKRLAYQPEEPMFCESW